MGRELKLLGVCGEGDGMRKNPHSVTCPVFAIEPCEVNCVQACDAVTTYLTVNPAEINELTLGGLNHVNTCDCPECVLLRKQVQKRFSRTFE